MVAVPTKRNMEKFGMRDLSKGNLAMVRSDKGPLVPETLNITSEDIKLLNSSALTSTFEFSPTEFSRPPMQHDFSEVPYINMHANTPDNTTELSDGNRRTLSFDNPEAKHVTRDENRAIGVKSDKILQEQLSIIVQKAVSAEMDKRGYPKFNCKRENLEGCVQKAVQQAMESVDMMNNQQLYHSQHLQIQRGFSGGVGFGATDTAMATTAFRARAPSGGGGGSLGQGEGGGKAPKKRRKSKV
jgi:hypothetical protein